MRISHPSLLPLALLLFIALAEMPASAFYNPNTGRWLNRDPIGEAGSANLYCPANNSLPNKIDSLGLTVWSYSTDYYYGQPPSQTGFRVGKLERGENGPWYNEVACAGDCVKVTNYRWQTIFFVYLAPVEADAQKLAPTLYNFSTPQGHEDTHIAVWESSYYRPMDDIYQLILDVCVSRKCFNAWTAYVTAADSYYETKAEVDNARWDIQDYAAESEKADAKRREGEESAKLPGLNATRSARWNTFLRDCH